MLPLVKLELEAPLDPTVDSKVEFQLLTHQESSGLWEALFLPFSTSLCRGPLLSLPGSHFFHFWPPMWGLRPSLVILAPRVRGQGKEGGRTWML